MSAIPVATPLRIPSLRELCQEAIRQYPEEPEKQRQSVKRRLKSDPVLAYALLESLLDRELGELLARLRHEDNRAIRRSPHSGSAANVFARMTLPRAGQEQSDESYREKARMFRMEQQIDRLGALGDLLPEQLLPIVEHRANMAKGARREALYLALVAKKARPGEIIRKSLTEKDLNGFFAAAEKEVNA